MSLMANASVIDDEIKKGQIDEAHKIVETEIEKSPNQPSTWLAYAKLMLVKNQLEKSWAGLSQARKLIQINNEPSDQVKKMEAEYYQIEGAWYFQKKAFEKAAQSFKQSSKVDEHNLETQIWLSSALLADHKLAEATKVINALYLADAKNEAGNFLYKIIRQSEKELQQLIKLQPELMMPKVALINLYLKKGQMAAAKKVIDKVPSSQVTQFPFVLLSSEISLSLSQPEEVIKKLKSLPETNEDYRLLGLFSMAHALLGNFDQASILFEKSLKAHEYKLPKVTQPIIISMMQNQVAYLDSLLMNAEYARQTNLPSSGLVKIAYYFKENQLVNARLEARKWLQSFPRQAFSYDVLGSVNRAEGDYPSAETAFKSAIKLNETYLPARLHLIDVLIKQRKYQEARKLLLDTSKKFKPDSKIFLLWSKLEEFEGNRDAAKKWLEKAASIEQGIEPGLEFVSFYLRQDRPKLALMLAESLARMHGDDIRLLNLLGGLYLENSQNYHRAVAVFEKLTQFMPEASGIVQNLSKSHQLSGHPEKAVMVLESYLFKNPDKLEVHRQLARLYIHNRNFDKAKLAFEKILKSDPDDFISLNNLASLYIELDPKKSLSFAKQAYEHAPDNASVCDTLGWAYYKNHQTNKALSYLVRANKLDENLADATYHLALVYREQGQKQAAVAYLKQALASSDSQFSARIQANTLLKNWTS